jgi:hypothetical protein
VLVDRSDAFVFGFSKLDVMFGRQAPATCVIHTATLSTRVVAAGIIAQIRGWPSPEAYKEAGACYVEFGHG